MITITGIYVGFMIGFILGSLITMQLYKPFIKELDERIKYWYNYNRTK
jgi:uncharacterized protein YneF (UPF0154 family)